MAFLRHRCCRFFVWHWESQWSSECRRAFWSATAQLSYQKEMQYVMDAFYGTTIAVWRAINILRGSVCSVIKQVSLEWSVWGPILSKHFSTGGVKATGWESQREGWYFSSWVWHNDSWFQAFGTSKDRYVEKSSQLFKTRPETPSGLNLCSVSSTSHMLSAMGCSSSAERVVLLFPLSRLSNGAKKRLRLLASVVFEWRGSGGFFKSSSSLPPVGFLWHFPNTR